MQNAFYQDKDGIADSALINVIINSCDRLIITDAEGKIVFFNSSFVGEDSELARTTIGKNVNTLVSDGFYDRSIIQKCISTQSEVTGIVKESDGRISISTCRPIFDEKGNLIYVVTNNRADSIIQRMNRELEHEKQQREHFEELSRYIIHSNLKGQELVGASPEMMKVLKTCNMFADTDASILIGGESGVGKDVIANYIYKKSKRCDGPYISLNCSAIHKDLVESELFGYEKGAFTGANKTGNRGVFEMADHGTLFLDEIGELPLSIQPKLLRVLENGEIKRIGSSKTTHVDVRIIAATNRNLKEMVKENLFREDLYYRLNVLHITVPPLRDRPDDIVPLTDFFLHKLNEKYNSDKHLSRETIAFLKRNQWPGNVRELKNYLERLFLTSDGDEIHYTGDHTIEVAPDTPHEEDRPIVIRNLKEEVKEFKLQYILRAVDQCNGKISEAAEKLGIHKSLIYKIAGDQLQTGPGSHK